jgi:5-(carboxyamino)imidazole ribonucleotide synthase
MTPLPPGSTIGILGGGQLGRMLALAAARLGFDVAILEPEENSPAARVAAHAIVGAYDDARALTALAEISDVITFEFENVPALAVERLIALGAHVAPNAQALAVAQDRVEEKTFLNSAGVPTVAFAKADTPEEAAEALHFIGAPALMKTRRDGYDGKGQKWVEHASTAQAVFAALGAKPVIVEAPADFVRELSVIAARGANGEIAVYPLSENHHEAGVLRRTVAPAEVPQETADQAERIAAQILTSLNYVGVIGIELFEHADGRLLVNEIAPRVHNTGHWTQDGCEVDQFEQHIRAVAGWPLGPTHATSRVEMVNLLGEEALAWAHLAGEPDARLHLYGKRDAKPGRKMGHVNRRRPLASSGHSHRSE